MTIDENKILAEVEQASAYIASSDPDHPEHFTALAATESDRPLLRRFYRESLAELPRLPQPSESSEYSEYSESPTSLGPSHPSEYSELSEYSESSSPSPESSQPSLKFVGRLAATLFTSVCSFLIDRILQRWFGIVSPARSAAYRESADDRLAHLRRLLASRVHRRQEPL